MTYWWNSPESLAIADRVADEGAQWALRRTVAIYAQAEGGAPVAHGTGVLLRIADASFIVSASHVLAVQDLELFVGTDAPRTQLISLGDLEVCASHDEDVADIGFIRLSTETANALEAHKQFVRLDEVSSTVSREVIYGIVGYPQALAAKDHEKREIDSSAAFIGTELYDGVPDRFREGVSITLAHSLIGVLPAGTMNRTPELQGISGCGIWHMLDLTTIPRRQWNPACLRLVGIEYGVVPGKYISGVRMSYALKCLGDTYPELRPAIELVRGLSA